MDKKTVTIDIKEYNLLKMKAEVLDLLRDRDNLNFKVSQINQVIQKKMQELQRSEQEIK